MIFCYCRHLTPTKHNSVENKARVGTETSTCSGWWCLQGEWSDINRKEKPFSLLAPRGNDFSISCLSLCHPSSVRMPHDPNRKIKPMAEKMEQIIARGVWGVSFLLTTICREQKHLSGRVLQISLVLSEELARFMKNLLKRNRMTHMLCFEGLIISTSLKK